MLKGDRGSLCSFVPYENFGRRFVTGEMECGEIIFKGFLGWWFIVMFLLIIAALFSLYHHHPKIK